MSNHDYGWKRFWCPRSGSINLADGGYLYDPDEKWGKAHNPDLVSLEAVADFPCVVLLGEPGVGKSRELEKLKKFTQDSMCESSQILELNLRSCTNLREDLFEDEIFTSWLDTSNHLYLFLDSLDEGILSIPTLAVGLVDQLNKPKYRNKIDRLYIRLACRTFVFPKILEEGLKNLWNEARFAIYELAPLRRIDVAKAAEIKAISSDNFLKGIYQNDIVPLAIRPVTLNFLLNTYSFYNNQFPAEQTLFELYLEGCRLLCEEINESRQGSNQLGNLDINQRLAIAARIAAITIFANRFSIWTGINQGNVPVEDLLLQDLCFGYEKVDGREFEITREAIKEVLDTGLFSSRGQCRMGWAHQTYAEFLAAWYLKQHEIPLELMQKILFSSEDPEHKLIPQLHEVTAWLASMRLDVLQEIIKTDPYILLQTDVPTDPEVRASIVENLLVWCEERKLLDQSRISFRNYRKLKHPGLAEQLYPYVCDACKQVDAREQAIDIVEACEVSELQEELAKLALDSTQSIYLRVNSAKAICSIGNDITKISLKPLAIRQLPEDEDDRLKGYVLQALWPGLLTEKELFRALTSPKKNHFFGAYQFFLKYNLVSQIQLSDLGTALDWLKEQGLRCFGHPFEEIGDAILFKSWENFDIPGVAEKFTQVALVQWREHQKIFTHDSELQEKFFSSLAQEIERRHVLIEASVLSILRTKEDPYFLLSTLAESVLGSEDTFWILRKFESSNCENEQKIWTQLIYSSFDRKNAKQIDAILEACENNNLLKEAFSFCFCPIDLNSSRAEKLRTSYLRMQKDKRESHLVEPPPQERISNFLDTLKTGDLSAWWRLNMDMTLKPTSRHYRNEYELNLTQLPGWEEADEVTRRRLVDGAEKYIQQQENIDYDWIGTNTLNRPALAGCRAFLLLLQKREDSLTALSPEIWKRWVPVIIAARSSEQHNDKDYLKLVNYAYINSPKEFINTLIYQIDKENQAYGYLMVVRRLSQCWDNQLKSILLDKAKDPLLQPQCMAELVEELLRQGVDEARDFAKSLIVSPAKLVGEERKKALIATRILVENLDPLSWIFLWKVILQNPSFGREAIESVAYRYSHGIQLDITESQLADFYIWLVHEYPYEEDPDHSKEVMAYYVTARDGIVGMREGTLSQLKERGTLEACTEIQRIIQEFPNITWLSKILADAQANMRRKTWQPLTPQKIFQLIVSQELSNQELSSQLDVIDKRTKIMKDEPKVDRSINVLGNMNVDGVVNTGDGDIDKKNNSDTSSTRFDWKFWLMLILTIVGAAFSGILVEEGRDFFFDRDLPSEVE